MAGYDPKKTRATPAAPEGNGRAAVDAVLDGPDPEPGPRSAPDQPGTVAERRAEPGPDRRLLAVGGLVALLVLLLILWRRRR